MSKNPKGTGSYFSKEHNGKTRYYWRISYKGKTIEKSAYTQAELKKKITTWKKEIEEIGFDPEQHTLAEFSDLYLDISTGNLKQHSLDWYKSICKLYLNKPPLGDKKLTQITPMQIEKFLNSLTDKISASSIAGIRRCLHIILNGAIKQGYLMHNPCSLAKAPRIKHKEIFIPSVEQVKHYLAIAREGKYVFDNCVFTENDGVIYMREQFYSVLLVSLFCGLRRGEVYGLTWDDVDLGQGTMNIHYTLAEDSLGKHLTEPKTEGSRRKISVPNNVLENLREWKEKQLIYANTYGDIFENTLNLVFPNTFGHPVNMSTANRGHWYKFRKACELPSDFHWHYWRHWHVSYLVSLGIDIAEITRRMGHADSAVTYRVYTHAFKQNDREIVDAINRDWK